MSRKIVIPVKNTSEFEDSNIPKDDYKNDLNLSKDEADLLLIKQIDEVVKIQMRKSLNASCVGIEEDKELNQEIPWLLKFV